MDLHQIESRLHDFVQLPCRRLYYHCHRLDMWIQKSHDLLCPLNLHISFAFWKKQHKAGVVYTGFIQIPCFFFICDPTDFYFFHPDSPRAFFLYPFCDIPQGMSRLFPMLQRHLLQFSQPQLQLLFPFFLSEIIFPITAATTARRMTPTTIVPSADPIHRPPSFKDQTCLIFRQVYKNGLYVQYCY